MKAMEGMLHTLKLLCVRRTRSRDLSRSMVSYSLSIASWHSSLSVRASSAARTYSRSADRPLSKLPLYSLQDHHIICSVLHFHETNWIKLY